MKTVYTINTSALKSTPQIVECVQDEECQIQVDARHVQLCPD